MFEVIIVCHGNLAQSFLQTAQLIMGDRKGVRTFGLNLGDSVDMLAQDVSNALAECLEHSDVLVLTDIRCGSPFNVTVAAMMEHKFRHITGVNLPMVIEALSSRNNMSLEDAADFVFKIGREGIQDAGEILNKSAQLNQR